MYRKRITANNTDLVRYNSERLWQILTLLIIIFGGSLFSGWINFPAQAKATSLPISKVIPRPDLSQRVVPTPNTYAWGNNNSGQLGNSTNDGTTPVSVTMPIGVSGFTSISAGGLHTLGLGNDGKLYAWGNNNSGQLGNSTSITSSSTPILVTMPTGVSGFTSVSAGRDFSLGLGNNGNLYAWGNNSNGQLGNSTSITSSSTPILVTMPTGVSGFTSISAGYDFSLGLGSDGKLYAWGSNYFAQLGNGTTTDTSVPVPVSRPDGVNSDFSFVAFAAGGQHGLGLGNNGHLYAWGRSDLGQLGNNSTTATLVPVLVSLPSGVTGFTAFAAGIAFSLAMGDDSKLYAWGYNGYGQLGNPLITATYSPMPVPVNLPTGVSLAAFAAGAAHGLGLGTDGKVYAWGDNTYGELGNGSNIPDFSSNPVPVTLNLPAGVAIKKIATGTTAAHNFAIVFTTTTASSYIYNLPLLANNSNTAVGQTTTFVTFQNLASSPANFTLQYYDINTGAAASRQTFTLPPLGQAAPPLNLSPGQSYGGIVGSDQPLNLVVTEGLSSGGSAYNVSSATASTLYSPLALNGQYGFQTAITVFNGGNATSTGNILFFDDAGNAVAGATKPFSVPAHASQTFKQSDAGSGLANNHAYWAKIVATNATDSLTAQVIEFGPANFVATFNAIVPSQVATTLYAPATFNGNYNFVTGIVLANPNGAAAMVNIKYYTADGTNVFTQTNLPIASNGVIGIFQPSVGGLPSNITSAVISSNQPLISTINERGPGTIAGTYVGLATGKTSVALPVMANGAFGFVTGATVFNTGSSPAHFSFIYLKQDGTSAVAAQTITLAPSASFLVYQGDMAQNLPSGFFGTAILTSDQPLLVTTNALNTSNNLFYTYTEPSN